MFVISAYLIKSHNNLELTKAEDLGTFISLYSGWVFNIYTNVKDVTGYATKKEWVPKDSANTTSSN